MLEGFFALRETVLHFTLLSGNDHSQENEENQIFEPIQTFDNNEDVVNFETMEIYSIVWMKKGSFTIFRNDKFFWSGIFTDQVIEQTLMRSGKP